ncbi:nuclear transport factor 2 family protein [Spirillospora sp. NPDC047418]
MTEHVSQRYGEAVDEADLTGLMSLFADDAVLHHPVGTYTGAEAMSGFFRDVVFTGRAVTKIATSCGDDHRERVETEATSPLSQDGGQVHAVDVFDLNGEGRDSRLAICYRRRTTTARRKV